MRSESTGWVVQRTNHSEKQDQLEEFALQQLHKKGKEYQPQELKSIKKYWQDEILLLVPVWREAGNIAQNEVVMMDTAERSFYDDYIPLTTFDDNIMSGIRFSERYNNRLENAKQNLV